MIRQETTGKDPIVLAAFSPYREFGVEEALK